MADLEITLPQGILRGKNVVTESGISYTSFQGIPYAKPPVGGLRFKDPQPAEKWSGILNAISDTKICSQLDMFVNFKYVGEEDCLYLNVYVPQNCNSSKILPVMFWIHGGAFVMGSGSTELYGPDRLMDRNIILVTINYRLGPFGFLCLNNDEVPGNAGMKDQVLALRWVNDNIKHFGGDKENITIFGESAGGVSTHALIISPLAKGLFSKAICQSGVVTSPWAIQNTPEDVVFRMADSLGLKTTDKDEVLSFLRTVSAEELVGASVKSEMGEFFPLEFCLVVEKPNCEGSTFIEKTPEEIIQSGNYNKVPTIFSCTSKEGLMMLFKLQSEDLENITLEKLVPDFLMFVPPDVREALGQEKSEAIANKIKHFYFENNEKLIENFADLMSDTVFLKYIDSSVRIHSKDPPPIYYCMFSYNGSYNGMKYILNYPYAGAAHADELGYLFHSTFKMLHKTIVPTNTDVLTVKRMTEMWTNFAKYGNPTPQLNNEITTLWEPVTQDKLNCFEISEQLKLIENPLEKRMTFWNDLMK